MTIYEIGAMQGLPRPILDQMIATNQPVTDIGAAIGDAMSINVLMRLLPPVLDAAGLLAEPCPDVWKHAASVTGVMPDALYIRRGCLKKAA